MAWQMKVTKMSGTERRQDPADSDRTIDVDVTVEGRFKAVVEYFDDADARTILHRKAFDFGAGTTPAAAVEKMKAEGRRVRDAKAALAAMSDGRDRVEGKTFAID